jgi:hypothetical protein
MSLNDLVQHIQSSFSDFDNRSGDATDPRPTVPSWLSEEVNGKIVEAGEEPLFDVELLDQILLGATIASPFGADALAYYRTGSKIRSHSGPAFGGHRINSHYDSGIGSVSGGQVTCA